MPFLMLMKPFAKTFSKDTLASALSSTGASTSETFATSSLTGGKITKWLRQTTIPTPRGCDFPTSPFYRYKPKENKTMKNILIRILALIGLVVRSEHLRVCRQRDDLHQRYIKADDGMKAIRSMLTKRLNIVSAKHSDVMLTARENRKSKEVAESRFRAQVKATELLRKGASHVQGIQGEKINDLIRRSESLAKAVKTERYHVKAKEKQRSELQTLFNELLADKEKADAKAVELEHRLWVGPVMCENQMFPNETTD
jgi:hypothetical protein